MRKLIVGGVAGEHRFQRLVGPPARRKFAALKRREQTAVNVELSLIDDLNGALEIARQNLIVVIERLVELCPALLGGATMQARAMRDIRLLPGADQRQTISIRKLLAILPGPVHEQRRFE